MASTHAVLLLDESEGMAFQETSGAEAAGEDIRLRARALLNTPEYTCLPLELFAGLVMSPRLNSLLET